jgi:hypothetical protein
MAKKLIETLAREVEGIEDTPAAYYQHIVDTLNVGQRQQCIDMFLGMRKANQLIFLNDYLDTYKDGFNLSVQRICIRALLT